MGAPSNEEQFLLEYINETRMDPLGSAARYIQSYQPLASNDPTVQFAVSFFGVNGASLLLAYQSLIPADPLAWNNSLGAAAAGHTQLLIETDSQSHQVPGEPGLGQRLIDAGYSFSAAAENVYAYAASMLVAHAGFMIDWGPGPDGMQSPPGHRNTIMSSAYREVGIGAIAESDPATSVGPWVVTQDFGRRLNDPSVILLGVSFQDVDGDRFYTPGEGRGGMSVSATGASTQSTSSGGYALELGAGLTTITFSGGGLSIPLLVSATLASQSNAKIDVVNASTIFSSVDLTLISGVTELVALGLRDLQFSGSVSAESLIGNSGHNHLNGAGGEDTLKGGGGQDTLDGGTGSDTASYAEKTASVNVLLNGSNWASVLVNGAAEDSIRDIEHLIGGTQDDVLQGDALANRLEGRLGNDDLRGNAGNDTLDGGEGIDRASYTEKTASVNVLLNGANAASVFVGGVLEDSIRNIENVIGGTQNDVMQGDALGNNLAGWNGNDDLRGNAGNDTLDGGAGIDRAWYTEKTASVSVLLNGANAASVFVGGVLEDSLRNIESVIGGTKNDVLQGDALANNLSGWQGNDDLRGNAGNDTLDGGEGIDRAWYTEKTASVSVVLNGANAVTVFVGGVAEDSLRNIESLIGGTAGDTLVGDALANNLAGWSGNDTLSGALGNDTLAGGEGSDRFLFNSTPGAGNIDTITDFQLTLDKIVLDDDIFTALGIVGTVAGVALTAALFQLGTAANDAGDRIVYNQATGQLFYDTDGNGVAAQQQIALIGVSTHAALTAGEFLVVA